MYTFLKRNKIVNDSSNNNIISLNAIKKENYSSFKTKRSKDIVKFKIIPLVILLPTDQQFC